MPASAKQNLTRVGRLYTHSEMIEKLLKLRRPNFGEKPVFVETGCGLSTLTLDKYAKAFNATAYSLDFNPHKSHALKTEMASRVGSIEFVIGDSLAGLKNITAKQDIDFLFLDSAASAMHTFKEFLICENALKPGASVLVDNAALPRETRTLSPVRKGKILVPYLLASPYWQVSAHPLAGDSMISALRHNSPDFADPEYEHPDYIDNWRELLDQALPKI